VQKGSGAAYCQNCGKPAQSGAVVCVSCGASLGVGAVGGGAKSKLTAGLLGIFLGSFGIHNFYLGFKNKALTQVLVSGISHLIGIFTCGIGYAVTIFPILGMAVWGLIEGIMILTSKVEADADGNRLTD